MKKVAGTKTRSSTIPWIGSVAKFGSDLDAVTLNVIEKGEETLKSWNKVWTILIQLKKKLQLSMLVQKSIEKCSCEQSERIWERFLGIS
jgi:hypothetical protein